MLSPGADREFISIESRVLAEAVLAPVLCGESHGVSEDQSVFYNNTIITSSSMY